MCCEVLNPLGNKEAPSKLKGELNVIRKDEIGK